MFCDIQTSWIWEKILHLQDQRPSIKFAYNGEGCVLIVVRRHMDHLSPIEK